jgi:sugar lactone lactonase YvrE
LRTDDDRPATGARVLCAAGDVLGEGPIWDHRSHRLLWVDILRGVVHGWSEASGMQDLLHINALIGSIALMGNTDLLLATSLGLMTWSDRSGETRLLSNPNADQPVRFNDGRVDCAGRFWVGTMALEPERYSEPLGSLYRYDPDGTLHRMEPELTISNGLDWSPDFRTFYLTDTMRRAIYAYDFDVDRGVISNRRVLISVDKANGFPDGLAVDCEGTLWSACFGAGCICRYDSRGRLIEKIAVPVSCPTAISFGGTDYETAFVTTSQHALGSGHGEVAAGSLLTLGVKSRGRRAAIFRAGARS